MILAVIPAKGESTRLPDKNLLKINGKTLIEHAVDFARRCKRIDKICVSTDDQEIASHSRGLGVEVVMRGGDLGGEVPLIEVYRHAWRKLGADKFSYVVGLQPDNPDRHIDPDEAIGYLIERDLDNLVTVGRDGLRNGSINVLSTAALKADHFVFAVTRKDECTNIHTSLDYHLAHHRMTEYSNSITVSGRRIGHDQPAFVIAEAACNHMCQMDLAKRMIDEAAAAGADAIKFQTYTAERLVTKHAVAFWGEEKIPQIEYYKRLDRFGEEEYRELFAHADEKKIIPFSSPFDVKNTEMLAGLGMPLFKIASCDINNIEHLKLVASFKRPIILSTGASSFEEVDRAVETIFAQGNYQLMLLACTLSYPTAYKDANLGRITTLRDRYPGMIVGISDHTEPDENMVVPALAVAMGARVVEKHYTLDRTMTGSGHFFAVDPGNLRKMVINIRLAEKVTGTGEMGVAASERKARESARRSIVAEIEIPKGTVIKKEMLGFKRPDDGLTADRIAEVVGRTAARDIAVDEKISREMLTG